MPIHSPDDHNANDRSLVFWCVRTWSCRFNMWFFTKMKPFISHSLPYKKLVPPFLVPVPVFSITDPFCKDTDRNFHFDLFAPIWIRIRAVWHVTLPVCINFINFKNLFLKIWKPKNLIFWQKLLFWNGRNIGNIMMHFFQVSRVSFHVSIVWARIHKSCWIKKDPIWIRIHKFTTLSNIFQFVIFEHLPV